MAICTLCKENQRNSTNKKSGVQANQTGNGNQSNPVNQANPPEQTGQANQSVLPIHATPRKRVNWSNWCDRCKVVTEGILGEIVWKMPNRWANTRICNLFQPLYDKPKSAKIQRIIEEFSPTNDLRWALLDDGEAAGTSGTGKSDRLTTGASSGADMTGADGKAPLGTPADSRLVKPAQARRLLVEWKQYFANLPLSRAATKHELRVLQRGVELHDGTLLSITGRMIFLDGQALPGNFPVEALRRAMTRRPKGGIAPTRFDWPKLIPTMSVLIDDENLKFSERQATTMARLINASHTAFRHIMLAKAQGFDLSLSRNPLSGVMRWLSWSLPGLPEEKIRPISRQPSDLHHRYHPLHAHRSRGYSSLTGSHIPAHAWEDALPGADPWAARWPNVGAGGV